MALTKVTSGGITADSIDGTKIADDAINSEHLVDGGIDNAHLADDAVAVAELSATGTASNTTFLRGDNSWQTAGSTSASDLTSGTLPDARFPSTLPAISGANLTGLSTFDPDGAVTINDTGADVDFRVESDDDANAFFIEGADGKVGIGTATPNSGLHVSSGDTWATRVQQTDAALHGFITQVPSPDASKYGITLYDTTAGDFTFKVMQNGAITAGSITTTSMPQKGGVDVVAHGSNSNGSYFKFADGTMICTVSKSTGQQNNGATAGAFYYSNSNTWTYPVAFTGSVRVVGNTEGGHYNAISVKTPSVGNSSCTFVTLSVNSTGNAQGVYLFAIGVWS